MAEVDVAGAGAASAEGDGAAGAAALPEVEAGAVGAAAGAGVAASVAAGALAACAHTGETGSRAAEAAIPISGAKRKLAVLRIVITQLVDSPGRASARQRNTPWARSCSHHS